MKKIELGKKALNKNISTLGCPFCFRKLYLENDMIKCSNNHSFDLSSKGYLNFLTGKTSENYSKESFSERRKVFNKNFFVPICDEIAEIIVHNKNIGIILDAGCGEGSVLNYILNSLSKDSKEYSGIGIDISKHGINLSTDFINTNFLPVVGNLSNMPFSSGSFQYIINFLSPANYKEFSRTLKSGGLLIKILPGENYLKEIRKYFYKEKQQKNYSNQDVLTHFKKHFPKFFEKDILYTVVSDRDYLGNIANMTPLSWNIEKSHMQDFLNNNNSVITCHFKIIWGHIS